MGIAQVVQAAVTGTTVMAPCKGSTTTTPGSRGTIGPGVPWAVTAAVVAGPVPRGTGPVVGEHQSGTQVSWAVAVISRVVISLAEVATAKKGLI